MELSGLTTLRSLSSSPVGAVDTIISIGLMTVMMFTALAFGTVEPWSLATFGMLTLALLVLWVIKGVMERRLEISAPATAGPLFALAGLGVLQSVTITDPAGKKFSISLDAEATRLVLEVLLVLLITFLLSSNFLAVGRGLHWLRNFLIFFGLGLAIFGLVQKFAWNGKYYWVIKPSVEPPPPFGPFINRNHFAGYLEMIAPIPAALILKRAVRGEMLFLYGFAAAMMGLAVVMSLSRGGMISLLAGLMFVAAFGFKGAPAYEDERRGIGRSPRIRMTALSRVGAVMAIVFTIGVGVWWVGADQVIRRVEKGELAMEDRSKTPGRETFFQSRGWVWRDTAAMIRDNWITGIGLGAYQTAYPIYSARDRNLIVSQAHNDYLQIMADGGILGALITLWFVFLVARDAVRASRRCDPFVAGTALGCAGGLFALMVHSLFDFNLQIPSNALLFLVLTSVVSRLGSGRNE